MNYIKEITIYLKTNAALAKPQKETEKTPKESSLNISNEGYVPFTYSMIVLPPPPVGQKAHDKSFQYNPLPYFTNYIKYSATLKTHLLNEGYEEVLKFFFNLPYFKSILQKYDITINPSIKESERNENSMENVEFMISLLFPTTFPAYNNIISSYDDIFKNNATSSTSNTMSFFDYLPNYMKTAISATNKYSYINIGGNLHTIYRVVLINDVINHPKFNFLIDKVHTFLENFDKERDGVIDSLINRFIGLREVLNFLNNNLIYLHLLNKAKQGQTETLDGYKYGNLFVDLVKFNIFDKNDKLIEDSISIQGILVSFLKDNKETYLFNKLKEGLKELVKYKNEFERTQSKNDRVISYQNNKIQEDMKIVSSTEINNIKDYLRYYEIYNNYYQYDTYYKEANIPKLKSIFYKDTSKKTRSQNENPYYSPIDTTFNVDTEAKDILQTDKSMSNYKSLFETFNTVSSDKILTDNTDFNNSLKTYIDVEKTPDTFLLYLYKILSVLEPKKNTTLTTVFDNDNVLKTKQDNIKKYCKMTIINTMEKTDKVQIGKYSVYIHLDLIAGKLDDTNLDGIKCKYRGEQLGNMYLKFLKPLEFWEIKPLPYLKMGTLFDKKQAVKKSTKPTVQKLAKTTAKKLAKTTAKKLAKPTIPKQKRVKGIPRNTQKTGKLPVQGGKNKSKKQNNPVRHTRKRHTGLF